MFLHCVQKNRVKLFSNWLLLRTQCYGTAIWKSYLFCFFIPYTYLLCNDLISHHSLPYTQQPCYSSFSRHAPIWKRSYLFTVLPGTSFRQIFSWLVPLETLGLTQRPCLKLQTLLDNSHTSFILSFFHSIYTIKLFSFLFYLATSKIKPPQVQNFCPLYVLLYSQSLLWVLENYWVKQIFHQNYLV